MADTKVKDKAVKLLSPLKKVPRRAMKLFTSPPKSAKKMVEAVGAKTTKKARRASIPTDDGAHIGKKAPPGGVATDGDDEENEGEQLFEDDFDPSAGGEDAEENSFASEGSGELDDQILGRKRKAGVAVINATLHSIDTPSREAFAKFEKEIRKETGLGRDVDIEPFITKKAAAQIDGMLRARGLWSNEGKEWLKLPHTDFFSLIYKAYPSNPLSEKKLGNCANALKLKVFPAQATNLFDQLWPLMEQAEVEKAGKETVAELKACEASEQEAVDIIIKNIPRKAHAPNPRFAENVQHGVKADKPKNLAALHVSLVAQLVEAEKAISAATGNWGFAVNIFEDDSSVPQKEAKKAKFEKKGKKSFEAGSKESCNACGRIGHVAGRESCFLVKFKHPDTNSKWGVPWKDSEKGKAWRATGKDWISGNKTLAGTSFDMAAARSKTFGEKKGNINCHTCMLIEESEVITSVESEGHTLRCGVITDDNFQHKVYIDALIDTLIILALNWQSG